MWPDDLIEDVARRRAVLFLGAGVSMNATNDHGHRPPSWNDFLNGALDKVENPKRHIEKLIKQGDYLTACEIIQQKLDEQYIRHLMDKFVSPKFLPAPIHTNIFKLDLRLVVTQNFDSIYDSYARSTSNNTILVKNYYDSDISDVLRSQHYYIVKAHGSIDQPGKMVFTRKQYNEARSQYSQFYSVFDSIAMCNTMIFLGSSLNDPDVRLSLEYLQHHYKTTRPHYVVCSKKAYHKDIEDSIRRNMNIKLLKYDPKNNHSELNVELGNLVSLVEAKRGDLSRNMKW